MTSIEKAIVDRNEERLAREGKSVKTTVILFFVVLVLTLGTSLYLCGISEGVQFFAVYGCIEAVIFVIVIVTCSTSYIPQLIGKQYRNKKFRKLLSENPDLAMKYDEDFSGAERIDVHEDFYPLWLGKENLFVSSLTEMMIIPYATIENVSVKEKTRLFPGKYNLNGRKLLYILVGLKEKRSQIIRIGYLESVQSARDIAEKLCDFL